jgi:hypothetical protein
MADLKEIEKLLNLQISKLEMRTWCRISEPFVSEKMQLIEKMISTGVWESQNFTLEFENLTHLVFRKINAVKNKKGVLSKKILSEMKKGKIIN